MAVWASERLALLSVATEVVAVEAAPVGEAAEQARTPAYGLLRRRLTAECRITERRDAYAFLLERERSLSA